MSEAGTLDVERVPPRVRRFAVATGATGIKTDYTTNKGTIGIRYDREDPPEAVTADDIDGYRLDMVHWTQTGGIYAHFHPEADQ